MDEVFIMKKTIKYVAIIALLGSCISVWAQEYKTREVPNAAAFSAIAVSGGDVDVYFSQGENHAYTISGPVKLVAATKDRVKENTLFIEYKEPFLSGDDNDVTVHVTAPDLSQITVYGEADFEVKTPFQGKELSIKTRQNGEVSIKNASIEQVNIDAKGNSSVDLDYIHAGKISVSSLDRAEVEISGSTGQLDILGKGKSAEIDTKKLVTTQTGKGTNNAAN